MRRTKAEIETARAMEADLAASIALQKTPEYQQKMADELATAVRKWRGPIPVSRAAQLLGMSKRTLEGIEQGRGFSYPILLTLALKTFD